MRTITSTDLNGMLSNPKGMVQLADGTFAVVNGGMGGSITIFDINDPLGARNISNADLKGMMDIPTCITTLSDGRLAVSNWSGNSITIVEFEEKREAPDFDYTKPKETRSIADGYLNIPVFSAQIDEKRLAICDADNQSIVIVDPTDATKPARILKNKDLNNSIKNPMGITLLPDGKLAVLNSEDASLAIIDPNNNWAAKRFAISGQKKKNALSGLITLRDGRLAYCDMDDNAIIILDPSKNFKIDRRIDASAIGHDLEQPSDLAQLSDGRLAVVNSDEDSISVIDLADLSNSTKVNISTQSNNPMPPYGITALPDGRLAVTYVEGDYPIKILDTSQNWKQVNISKDALNKSVVEPYGVTLLSNGALAVCNSSNGNVTIIEFEEKEAKIDIAARMLEESDQEAEQRFTTGSRYIESNSVLFNNHPELETRYLFNLFYLPELLKDIPMNTLSPYLCYFDNSALRMMTPGSIEETRQYFTELTHSQKESFAGFVNDVYTDHMDREEFGAMLARWARLHDRLCSEGMSEARDVFGGFASSKASLLKPDFDTGSIEDGFLRSACIYLMGDVKDLLNPEQRLGIPGVVSETVEGISLAAVNHTYNASPERVSAIDSVGSYKALVDDQVGTDNLLEMDQDINKAVYGQDKTDNLLMRENVQNARDAIVTERIAARCLRLYYEKHWLHRHVRAANMDAIFSSEEIPAEDRGRILERVMVLDRIIAGRMSMGKKRPQLAGALENEYNSAFIKIRNYIDSQTGDWIVSVEDPAGMDLRTIFGPLFVLGESTKIDSAMSEGILGMGFYTNFADFDMVSITTGVGNGTFHELVLERQNGSIVITSLKELKGPYKGTRIERVKRFKEGETADLDAVFIEYNTHRYIAAVQDVDINYNGKKINENLDLLSAVSTPYGDFSLYRTDTPYQRLTRSMLYVEHPKTDEYFALVPEHYLEILKSKGFVMDIGKGIPLV
ncbi:MAG: hypothetical protein ABH875_07680, partial [Candidatus Omnitrophota bacterium]